MNNNWKNFIKEEEKKEYYQNLQKFIEEEYKEKEIFPKKTDVFKAFELTDFNNVKVVILGQDPYHGENQAEGLSFSVKNNQKKPPSLRNIFKELEEDMNIKYPDNNSLISWAEEGVLLLNSTLTVEKGKPGSHQKKGWEIFTDNVIKKLNENSNHIVFILWGNFAKEKEKLLTNENHYVIKSAHPSPFSAYNGFFGSKPFSKANEFLIRNNIKPINWNIECNNINYKQETFNLK